MKNRLALVDCAGQDIHDGRTNEVADKGMLGLVEQFNRGAHLDHSAVIHNNNLVGKGQCFYLVMCDINHGHTDLLV